MGIQNVARDIFPGGNKDAKAVLYNEAWTMGKILYNGQSCKGNRDIFT